MDKPTYQSSHKTVLDTLLLDIPDVTGGKMFGYPAYYVKKKLFACVYGEGVGVKVPQKLTMELLSRAHVVPFQPLGKPRMREWVQINREVSSDYEGDMDIFRASIEFVRHSAAPQCRVPGIRPVMARHSLHRKLPTAMPSEQCPPKDPK